MPSASDATVVVCTRNRPDMLAAALVAIRAASRGAVDVLVVDSASDTDDTRRVAEDAGVGYVRSGKGLSVARNVGIVTASRPIVVFTDDDCRPTEGWIEALTSHFAEADVAAATGRMLDHTQSTDAPYHRATRYATPLSGIDAGHGAVMAFRRETLLRIGGFDDLMGAGQHLAGAEDLDIFIRLLHAGTQIVHDRSAVVLHANTRVGDAYVELHRGYGRGLGALVGKWLRREPVFGLRVAWKIVGRTTARIARDLLARRRSLRDRAMLAGIVEGVADTWRVPIVGERFIPGWQTDGLPALVTTPAGAGEREAR